MLRIWVLCLTELKFDRQINSFVKNIFFQLRNITQLKSVLSFSDLVKAIHAFISSHLDYCYALSGL